jgi:hypothetical protein
MVTIFLPCALILFCISIGVGKVLESQVKYLFPFVCSISCASGQWVKGEGEPDKPKDVIRIVELLEHRFHRGDIFLVAIVPAALMISKRKHGWELLCPGELAILSPNILWGRAGHQEEVDISCLRQPMSVAANTG